MRLFVFASVLLAVHAVTDKQLWSEFKQMYGREYRNLREEQRRYTIFQDNLRVIEVHNAQYERGEVSYYMGINKFADMTPLEFHFMLNKDIYSKPKSNQSIVWHQPTDIEAAKTINWVSKGVVTPVKDQSDCGSCWAFSTTGAIEGAYAIKTGSLISLSEQNLIDCVTLSYGCDGGWKETAFDYVRNNGIEKESDYPYAARDGSCQYTSSKSALKISGYINVGRTEEELLDAVANVGPIGIAINADYLIYYAGGVLDEPACKGTDEVLNHEVLLVGYGTQNGLDYWLVKNSWGTDWGENGYVKMIRNRNNQCGVATDASYPVI